MSKGLTESKKEKIREILDLLRQLPPEFVESLLQQWMWLLDDVWRKEGMPDDIEERIREVQKWINEDRSAEGDSA